MVIRSLIEATASPVRKDSAPPERSEAIQPTTKPVVSGSVCATCGGDRLWRPHGSQSWHCEKCSPPSSRALIAELRQQSLGSAETFELCCGVPACPACKSTRVIVGTAGYRCTTCKAKVDDGVMSIIFFGEEFKS